REGGGEHAGEKRDRNSDLASDLPPVERVRGTCRLVDEDTDARPDAARAGHDRAEEEGREQPASCRRRTENATRDQPDEDGSEDAVHADREHSANRVADALG